MRFIKVYLKIIFSVIIANSLISCQPDKKIDYEFQDSTKIEKVNNFQELNIDYDKGVFFVSNNKGTQIDIYNSNTKNTTINFAEIKETIVGKEIKGQAVTKMASYDEKYLILLRRFPYEFHLMEKNKDYALQKFKLDIPDSEWIADFGKFNDETVVFNTYGVESYKESKIYSYNFKSQTATLLHEEILENPMANYYRIDSENGNIHFLKTDKKEINTFNIKGELLSKKTFTTPTEHNYNIVEKKRYASIEDYKSSEIDPQIFTEVWDFQLYENSVLLILVQVSGTKILDRVLVKCSFDDEFPSSIIQSKYTPIHFGHNGHLYRYYEKDSIQSIEIVPLNILVNSN